MLLLEALDCPNDVTKITHALEVYMQKDIYNQNVSVLVYHPSLKNCPDSHAG